MRAAIEQGTGKDSRYFELVGVPRGLVDEFSKRSREVAHAAERFRAKYGRAPERGELRNLALENRKAKELTTRADLQRVWQDTGRRHDFDADEALRLLAAEPSKPSRTIEDRIEQRLTEHHAIFDPVVLRAVALEQSAGEMTPDMALGVAREMVRDRHVIPLEGDRMTTLAVRAQEQAIERRAKQLARPVGRDVGERARADAAREVAERISGQLSPEQDHALRVLTGPERATVLVGPAGTGKGVVIDAAARAERHAGRHTIGIAVSGSTAERLGADSPALAERTLTLDALVARANTATIDVDQGTTVFLDEAGMVDHKRLDALTELIERSGAKLIAVGDGKQLPSIGPGGMFDRLTTHAPTAELEDVHRTSDPGERKAWRALRNGEPEKAMAHYVSRGQLYFRDTRDEAGETAVQRWHTLTQKHGLRQVALIADASNMEIDRLNARAQHLRAQNGELGHHEIRLPHVHYGVRQGDLITFTTQHRPPGQPRVENGTRGQIAAVHEHDSVTITLDGSDRHIHLDPDDLGSIHLAYAQHVYRQQGATVERSVIVTGGWQTSKESAYVEATRARHGTEWYIARDQLGEHGQDPDRVQRLAQHMRNSRAQTPSVAHQERADPDWSPSVDPLRLISRPVEDLLLACASRGDRASRDIGRGR
ncbi:MAG TPA: AAA family ATPase [Solirubrobacteraceae bacterium]|nr:AAA family ATPase [Solirubrobacteraceae bacterium]